MNKLSAESTARESVWEHRIRQKVALERIVYEIGNSKEKNRAKQFLDAMKNAYPEMLEDIEQYMLELIYEGQQDPELFDESEYTGMTGRKTALKFPSDIEWEDRIVQRASREYRDLFHPCENRFNDAMKGLQYLSIIHPKLFSRGTELAIREKNRVLDAELYCKCNCINPGNSAPGESFKRSNKGRLAKVSQRIESARESIKDKGENRNIDWQFFLDRVKELAPEMLE